jgi:hypothetical protein
MKEYRFGIGALLLAGLGLAGAVTWSARDAARQGAVIRPAHLVSTHRPEKQDERTVRLQHAFGKMPLQFEANRGQTDRRVKFLSRGSGYSLFLTPTEAVFALQKPPATPATIPSAASKTGKQSVAAQTTVLRLQLVGANPNPPLAGREALPGKVNYLLGSDPKKWRRNVPTYNKVAYQSVYPGVDLVYYGNQRELEYDFVVAPGADPQRIRLAFTGADKVEVDDKGDLLLDTAGGQVRQHKPLIYQEVDGVRQEIAGGYVLYDRQQVGFSVGAYDAKKPLIIDPVLVYSTYLGGSSAEQGFGIAVDREGNAYVAGNTNSSDFPTMNALQPEVRSVDAFVTKIGEEASAPRVLAGAGNR